MKLRSSFVTWVLFALLLSTTLFYMAHAENYVQYQIAVNADGSADWTITQATDLNETVESWSAFQQKITGIVDNSANLTNREMGVDPDSLQMSTVWETQSHTTEYQFTWLNFSVAKDGQIVFGDVFHISGFFSQLYGDGILEVYYPSNYTIQSVFPQPNGAGDDSQTLNWLGTQFFVKGNPDVVLSESSSSPIPNKNVNEAGWQLYALLVFAIAVAVAISSAGFYLYKRRRSKISEPSKPKPLLDPPAIETEEEKIIRLIRSRGGCMYQSAITDQCKFSKAKTSLLLTALEHKGVVARYKKGRDKIVTLSAQGEGEKP
jgi:uncharacterized membrane protein